MKVQGGNGFIKSYRSILDWEWFKDARTLQMWIYILHRANYEPSQFKGITIGRGQFLESLSTMSQNTGMTVRMCRTSLNHLKSTHEVTWKVTRYGLLINVEKYSIYQSSD